MFEMNEELQQFAKQYIREGLEKLPGRPQEIFRLMYGRNNGKRSVADAQVMDIEDVLAEMASAHLNHAMSQVKRTLEELK